MLSDAAMEKRSLQSEHYNAFAQHLCSLLNTLMERSYHSQYSPNLRKCLNGFFKANLNARFMPTVPAFAVQVDRCRAYTAELVSLDKVPVFTCFDDFEAYDGHPVEPHTLYLIENTLSSVDAWIICNERYGLVSGHVLTQSAIPFRILASIRPSHLSDNAASVVVEELYKWAAPGCDVFRKRAVNIAIGMTGKRTARNEVAWFTTDPEESAGADAIPLPGGGQLCVMQSPKTELVEGFYAGWQFAIYDRARFSMLQLYRDLQAAGATVYGIATDAFFVDGLPVGLKLAHTKGFNTLGQPMFNEEFKCIPRDLYAVADNAQPVQLLPTPSWIPTETVQDRNFVTGRVPGSGKSDTMRQQTPSDALWVCPTNEQCHRVQTEYGVQAITFHKLLGIPVGDADCTPFKLDGIMHVCMDEMLQLDDRMLVRVVRWIREHPELAIFGNCDARQNTAGFALNNVDRPAYLDMVLRQAFDKRLTLGINRRLQSDADRALFDRLFDDLFVRKLPLPKAAANAGFARMWTMAEVKSNGIRKAVTYTNGTLQCARSETDAEQH